MIALENRRSTFVADITHNSGACRALRSSAKASVTVIMDGVDVRPELESDAVATIRSAIEFIIPESKRIRRVQRVA
jgi:hypothetical protein